MDYPNKIRKATNRVNKAIDSVNANLNRAYPIKVFANKGLRLAALIKDPNTIPIPAPTPANAINALPAPIIFAACNMVIENRINTPRLKRIETVFTKTPLS